MFAQGESKNSATKHLLSDPVTHECVSNRFHTEPGKRRKFLSAALIQLVNSTSEFESARTRETLVSDAKDDGERRWARR